MIFLPDPLADWLIDHLVILITTDDLLTSHLVVLALLPKVILSVDLGSPLCWLNLSPMFVDSDNFCLFLRGFLCSFAVPFMLDCALEAQEGPLSQYWSILFVMGSCLSVTPGVKGV